MAELVQRVTFTVPADGIPLGPEGCVLPAGQYPGTVTRHITESGRETSNAAVIQVDASALPQVDIPPSLPVVAMLVDVTPAYASGAIQDDRRSGRG